MNPKIRPIVKVSGYKFEEPSYDAIFSVARAPEEGGLCMTVVDDNGRPFTMKETEYIIINHAELMEPAQLVADPLAGLVLAPGSPVLLGPKG